MNRKLRAGKVLLFVGLLLTVLLGMTALAVDIGLIAVTRCQLQAASDSGSLAGGTELLPGLGASAYRTATQVESAAKTQAVTYVSYHRAGEAASAYIEAGRDVQLGKAIMQNGQWVFNWGATPYNAVRVTTLRSSVGSTSGDGPLPLVFARILGTQTAEVTTDSVAVILPASGVRVIPGSGKTSALGPFAFSKVRWEKYWRARHYFEDAGFTNDDLSEANDGHLILDNADLDADGNPKPLFYEKIVSGQNGNVTYRQLFADQYSVIDPELETPSNVVGIADGVLELNIYPIGTSEGNFGTVNVGNTNNSTQVLVDQISNGIGDQYLANYENGTLTASPGSPLELTGDTGISSGIQSSLEGLVGQKRAIMLYDSVNSPGNTAMYTLIDFAAIRIMEVNLTGQNKVLVVQPDTLSDSSFVPDYTKEITEETTFFSPLILAK